MAKSKGRYIANIYVPDSETDVKAWLNHQDSASKSMRALIHWAIGRWGQQDIFVAEFAKKAADEPEEAHPDEKPSTSTAKPFVPKAHPKKEPPSDIVNTWRNLLP